MTPGQRLTLSARQAAEQAQRLAAWLEAGRSSRPELQCLSDEVESIAGAIGRIIDAVDQRPAIGVVGGHGSGKTAFVAAVAGAVERPLRAEFPNREASLDVLSSIIPHRGGARTSAAIRLSRSELPQAPRGFPVRVRLLAQLDLVKMLFRAHAAHLGADPSQLPTALSVTAAFTDAERHLQPRAVAGLSARDIAELREDVHGFAPRAPLLQALAAAGFWDRLALVVAHLPETERTRLVALLWNEEPVLTAIYALLHGTIEKLGHVGEVFCELSAIVTREPATGWMVPHRSSIVAADTLAGLAHALGPAPASTVQVSGRFGGAIAVDRAVLAALAAELPLTVQVPPVAALPETDVVTFPGASAVADVVRPEPVVATGDDPGIVRGGLGTEAAAAMIAHAKSGYLVERAARRHDLTSLVVCIDPEQPVDDLLSTAIGDWVDVTQGAEPQQRERMRASLFVVASRPLAAGETALRVEPWRDATADRGVRDWLAEGVGAGQDWPDEWTTAHPFENVFALRRPIGRAGGARAGDAQLRLVQQEPAAPAPSSADGIVRILKAVATRAKKHRQLGYALAELRRGLRARVLRHHLSNDPIELAEWRRQVANVDVNRLRRSGPVARSRRISAGALVSGLGITERELAAAVAGAVRQPGTARFAYRPGGAELVPGAAPALENPSICHDSAAAAVTYWLRAMRQAGRSARFCRHLGVPQTVLQHVLDEIAIGASRTGLVADVTAAFGRLPAAVVAAAFDPRVAGAGPGAAGSVGGVHLAATGVRIIDTYLASIPRGGQGNGLAGATGEAIDGPSWSAHGSGELSLARLDSGNGLRDEGGRGRPAFGDADWHLAIASLVEANIAAAPGLVQSAERDRELGELVAGFASSPFEVEL